MVLLTDTQAVALPTDHTVMDVLVGAILVATQLGTVLVSHLKGKRGARVATEGLDRRLATLANDLRTAIGLTGDSIRNDVTSLSTDVRDLKAYVVGPDGQNGLRGDVKELKTQVTGLLSREPRRKR